MIFRLTPSIRLAIRLRTQAANQRADARKLCVKMMQHAAMGIDLRLVPGLAEIAAEQWVSSQELEEACRS
jgi:hypothetical protein